MCYASRPTVHTAASSGTWLFVAVQICSTLPPQHPLDLELLLLLSPALTSLRTTAGLDQGDNMNTYGTTSAAGHHGNTVGNVGQQSYAPQGTGFGGTTGSGVGHTGPHTGHGLHSHNTASGVGTSNTPILGGEGAGHTGMGHTGTHGMHGQHGHGMGTGAGTDSHLTHGTDQRTGHMLGDDSHSYGAGVGPDHKAGHKASKATKGAEYDATGGAVDDRTVGQKIKDAFTPGSDVGKHTKH